ncbi:MAG TPA: hypothetical protein DCY13_18420 [Verrucomicrobiales bacterium]|nr:hypothetical protein [Verrucomicrobiales bacterium]
MKSKNSRLAPALLNVSEPADGAAPIEAMAPWQQVALLRHQQRTGDARRQEISPRLKLRGDRVHLRALRAAETTAWGDTNFFELDRSIIRHQLMTGA